MDAKKYAPGWRLEWARAIQRARGRTPPPTGATRWPTRPRRTRAQRPRERRGSRTRALLAVVVLRLQTRVPKVEDLSACSRVGCKFKEKSLDGARRWRGPDKAAGASLLSTTSTLSSGQRAPKSRRVAPALDDIGTSQKRTLLAQSRAGQGREPPTSLSRLPSSAPDTH